MIDLVFFLSTKSRYGRTNDYKVTLTSFFNLVQPSFFAQRFLNLKVFKDDDKQEEEIKRFFGQFDFKINTIYDLRKGTDIDRDAQRNELIIGTILDDIASFFVQYEPVLNDHVFLLEDDSPVVFNPIQSVWQQLSHMIDHSYRSLEENVNLQSIHFARKSLFGKPSTTEEWLAYHKFEVDSDGLIKNNYFYNFQPRLCRTSDLTKACSLIRGQWHLFKHHHPEEGLKVALLNYNPNATWWAFNPEDAYSVHLGEEPAIHKQVLESEPELAKLYDSNP